MIASISRVLYEAQTSLGFKLEPKAVKIDFKSERDLKEMIKQTFQKPTSSRFYESARDQNYDEEEKIQDDERGEMLGLSHKRSLLFEAPFMDQDAAGAEDPYMQSAIILRRGRCGRLFAKYIQKSIFEDSENLGGLSDNETAEELEKKVMLRKRRKRYQEL